ncbi:MAG: cysteine--tRNA ligase [Rhodospirillaceae bacterium]|nr:cysteine--tRNA ligase [Rhodospirillaceae bacterium]
MSLYIHNTLSGKREIFEPADPDRVTIYVCGPTVYNHPHIGNARPAVAFDVLVRLLRHIYSRVVYARNITDVDDKINAAAFEEGVPIAAITDRYTKIYHQDMGALGVLPPDIEPKATDHIEEMQQMIERLVAKGHAYAAEGHVLFDVTSYADYGCLSKRDQDEIIAGARVEVAPYKQNASDFVLWKPSTGDQPGWSSPWGYGRPGWHMECSAMIERHLGQTIDIHAGGQDLVFPHHENEIAQSVCAHDGACFVRYWMHNGFVNIEEEKMSKSVGNVTLVCDLLGQAPGEAIRYALLAAHYRQPLNWSGEGLALAKRNLDRLYEALRLLGDVVLDEEPTPAASVVEALSEDINTPRAMAEMAALARAANTALDGPSRKKAKADLIGSGMLLGILQQDPDVWFAQGREVDHTEIDLMVEARNTARAAKDFAEADRIRDELSELGIVIEDKPEGTSWRVTG